MVLVDQHLNVYYLDLSMYISYIICVLLIVSDSFILHVCINFPLCIGVSCVGACFEASGLLHFLNNHPVWNRQLTESHGLFLNMLSLNFRHKPIFSLLNCCFSEVFYYFRSFPKIRKLIRQRCFSLDSYLGDHVSLTSCLFFCTLPRYPRQPFFTFIFSICNPKFSFFFYFNFIFYGNSVLLYIILREVMIMLTSRIYSAFFSFAIAISLKTPDPSQMKGRSYPDILMEQRMRKEEVETIFIRCFFYKLVFIHQNRKAKAKNQRQPLMLFPFLCYRLKLERKFLKKLSLENFK